MAAVQEHLTGKATTAAFVFPDLPTSKRADDALGFSAYVETLRDLLLNKDTGAPLTVSIEGDWGAGKTSFLYLLRAAVEEAGHATVFFDAWRHDGDQSLLAAFALECIRQLRKRESMIVRFVREVRLRFSRVVFTDALPALLAFLARLLALVVGTVAIAMLLFQHGSTAIASQLFALAQDPSEKATAGVLIGCGGLVGYLFFLVQISKGLLEVTGNPFDLKLENLMNDPGYRSRVSFVENFRADFARILTYYAGSKRLFIFVDDLDRCDVPKAADLMQGINYLVASSPDRSATTAASAEANDVYSSIVFVIAMDREIVAASLSAKYKDLQPYLMGSGSSSTTPDTMLEFGYSFMDKFIQLPFRIPRMKPENAKSLQETLANPLPSAQLKQFHDPGQTFDSERVKSIITMASSVLDDNPRRLKQFINVFRLNLLLFRNLGYVTDSPPTAGEGALGDENLQITPEQLGKFIAITLRWPRILEYLERVPKLLCELQKMALTEDKSYAPSIPTEPWSGRPELMAFLALCSNDSFSEDIDAQQRIRYFDLSKTNFRRLIEIVPSSRSGYLSESVRPARVRTGVERSSIGGSHAIGNAGLVACSRGALAGHLELISPLRQGGFAHFTCDPRATEPQWRRRSTFAEHDGIFDDVSLIQSHYDNGNLELICRQGNTMSFYFWRGERQEWIGPYEFKFDVQGPPMFIQSNLTNEGNFELVVPMNGELKHWWRNNRALPRNWLGPYDIPGSFGTQPVALFETIKSEISDLDVIGFDGDDLVRFSRRTYRWRNDRVSMRYDGKGRPQVLRESPTSLSFEIIAPSKAGGLKHTRYDGASLSRKPLGTFAGTLGYVNSVVAAKHGERYDVIARAHDTLYHIYKNPNEAWSEALPLAEDGADSAYAAGEPLAAR